MLFWIFYSIAILTGIPLIFYFKNYFKNHLLIIFNFLSVYAVLVSTTGIIVGKKGEINILWVTPVLLVLTILFLFILFKIVINPIKEIKLKLEHSSKLK